MAIQKFYFSVPDVPSMVRWGQCWWTGWLRATPSSSCCRRLSTWLSTSLTSSSRWAFPQSFPPLLVIPRVSVERRLHHPPWETAAGWCDGHVHCQQGGGNLLAGNQWLRLHHWQRLQLRRDPWDGAEDVENTRVQLLQTSPTSLPSQELQGRYVHCTVQSYLKVAV